VPVWTFIRRCGPQRLFDNKQIQPKITQLHIQRAYLNVFLYLFAPCTRQAMEAMVWVNTCSSGDEVCEPVLAFDNGQKYMQGEHVVGSVFACGVIIIIAVIVPLHLIFKVRRARAARDVAFAANVQHVERWFREVDDDNSGTIELQEVPLLLKLVGES